MTDEELHDDEWRSTRPYSIWRSPIWVYLTAASLIVVVFNFWVSTWPTEDNADTKPTTVAFANDSGDYSLKYPSSWSRLDREEISKFQGIYDFALRKSSPSAFLGVRLQERASADVDLDKVATALDRSLPRNFDRFRKLGEWRGSTTSGEDALIYDYSFASPGADDTKIREQLTVVMDDDSIIHVVTWANDSHFDEVKADFDRIVGTFELL